MSLVLDLPIFLSCTFISLSFGKPDLVFFAYTSDDPSLKNIWHWFWTKAAEKRKTQRDKQSISLLVYAYVTGLKLHIAQKNIMFQTLDGVFTWESTKFNGSLNRRFFSTNKIIEPTVERMSP